MSVALAFMIFGACVVSFGALILGSLLRNWSGGPTAYHGSWKCTACTGYMAEYAKRSGELTVYFYCPIHHCRRYGLLYELPPQAFIAMIPKGRIPE